MVSAVYCRVRSSVVFSPRRPLRLPDCLRKQARRPRRGKRLSCGGGDLTTSYEEEFAARRLFARGGRGFDSAVLGRRARETKRRSLIVDDDDDHGFGGKGRRR